MRKRTLGLAVATIATASTIVLAGCTGQSEPTPTASPTPSSSGITMPDLDQFTTAPSGTPLDEEGGATTVDPKPAPPWDAEQRAAAIAAAEKALTAFARPDLSSADWWAALSPLLTSQAQQDYQYVDPANIPAHQVTGAGKIVDDSSRYAVSVDVPSNAGTYTIVLTRINGAAPWLAARFTPPAGTH